MPEFTPEAIVRELDKHIIGQQAAKRAVAIALRNRWRRTQVEEELRNEITPKNILMIGPTGVGKTEIARRLAKLANAPFIKVEATKFTEVGYVGREVAAAAAEERILDALLPPARTTSWDEEAVPVRTDGGGTREKFRAKLRSGELDDKEIEIETSGTSLGVEIMAPPGMEEMTSQLQGLFQNLGGQRTKRRKLRIKDAIAQIRDEEAAKRVDEEDLKLRALEMVEQHGIVFLDELDKVASRSEHQGADVSREGVQRDLLPLVEGCTISTKHGMVKTDHILFIASGAFHLSRPSDLIPELQGRLPIRVELDALSTTDFIRILTEPDASLTEQYQALLRTEGVDVQFTEDGIQRVAEIAWQVNEKTENIGARRLHTVMERLLEEVSFMAPTYAGQSITVDAEYVKRSLADLADDEDLTRYIL